MEKLLDTAEAYEKDADIPNAETQAAMAEAEEILQNRRRTRESWNAPWSSLIASLDLFTDDFMADGRGDLKLEEREIL